MQLSTKLILASQSPRRRELLEQLQLTFTVRVSPAEEVIPEGEPPAVVAQTIATQKAIPVAAEHPTALTLAADTIVVHDDEILGKPTSKRHAVQMLDRLQGTTHDVYTGVCLVHPTSNREVTCYERTRVTFAAIESDEIEAYVASGSPMDKAGGYGIQDRMGPLYIEGIAGDYYNVMGLPLRRLYVTLKSDFSDLLLF
ncbi:septum formation protein Maf [Longibacter salinarum]|uniref:dTTP/UTP pyrophosphatase n=1 Tax=Longibacter salinarum TaxID=1850348 RepID=A0A2A8D2X1_9BACT|nr:Maf family protein [Longibacter salinarum]PEN15167.1 septum formation protein Maf [Longibacter salinarum]